MLLRGLITNISTNVSAVTVYENEGVSDWSHFLNRLFSSSSEDLALCVSAVLWEKMDRGFEQATFHSVQMIIQRLRPFGHEDWDVERYLQLLQNRCVWIKSTHVWQYNVSNWLLFDVYGNWLQDKICISFTNVNRICFWIKNFSVQVEIFSAPKAFIAPTPLGHLGSYA